MSTENEMHGTPLKKPRGYSFVKLFPHPVKHMFGSNDGPQRGDFTVCGQKIVGNYTWACRAVALDGEYCRDCERIWGQS